MTTRSVTHGSFTIEREYDIERPRVYAAWADPEVKDEWFGSGDKDFDPATDTYEMDFRLGGVEVLDGALHDGRHFTLRAVYGDIVENERIVMSYEVLIDHVRISVSLMTIEFVEIDSGTKLIATEQGAFLDGLDTSEKRIVGATDSIDRMSAFLARSKTPVGAAS